MILSCAMCGYIRLHIYKFTDFADILLFSKTQYFKVIFKTDMYLIVKFICERKEPVEVVNAIWCDRAKSTVQWPPHELRAEYKQFLISLALQDDLWSCHNVEVLYETGLYSTSLSICVLFAITDSVAKVLHKINMFIQRFNIVRRQEPGYYIRLILLFK